MRKTKNTLDDDKRNILGSIYLNNAELFRQYLTTNKSLFKDICKNKQYFFLPQEAVSKKNLFFPSGNLPLVHIIAYFDSLECLVILHEAMKNINVDSVFHISPLLYAVVGRSYECVSYLANAGCDVNCTYKDKSALYYAVNANDSNMVELLLNLGANVDNGKLSTITHSMSKFNLNIFQILVQNNTKSNNIQDILTHAVAINLVEAITEILKRGVSPNIESYNGYPLLIALKFNNVDAVNTLLRFNADISVKDSNGRNTLHYAVESGNFELVKLITNELLKKEKCDTLRDLNLLDKSKQNPLFGIDTLKTDVAEKILDFLLEKGLDINSFDFQRRTLLSISLCSFTLQKPEFIKHLLEKGANTLALFPVIENSKDQLTIFEVVRDEKIAVNPEVRSIIIKNGKDKEEEIIRKKTVVRPTIRLPEKTKWKLPK